MDFESIYRDYSKMLFHYILGMCHDKALAEDILQTTFLKAIERIGQYHEDSKFTTWLFQIAKNEYLGYLRKKKRHSSLETEELPEAAKQEDSTLEQLIDREDARRLRRCIHGLEEPFKEIVMLRIYGECSYKEIGNIFGKSEVWARVSFFRAKERIMKEYSGQE